MTAASPIPQKSTLDTSVIRRVLDDGWHLGLLFVGGDDLLYSSDGERKYRAFAHKDMPAGVGPRYEHVADSPEEALTTVARMARRHQE